MRVSARFLRTRHERPCLRSPSRKGDFARARFHKWRNPSDHNGGPYLVESPAPRNYQPPLVIQLRIDFRDQRYLPLLVSSSSITDLNYPENNGEEGREAKREKRERTVTDRLGNWGTTLPQHRAANAKPFRRREDRVCISLFSVGI